MSGTPVSVAAGTPVFNAFSNCARPIAAGGDDLARVLDGFPRQTAPIRPVVVSRHPRSRIVGDVRILGDRLSETPASR
jgi:hypothetical protein